MWIDDRGSEVLTLSEWRRLLAVAAKEHRHGHLGVAKDRAPLVLPVAYAVHGPDVVLRIGEGLFHQVDTRLVAFQVDGVTKMGGVEGDQSKTWSVLIQGLAIEDGQNVRNRRWPERADDPCAASRDRRTGRTGCPHPRRRCDRPSLSDSIESFVDPSRHTSALTPSHLDGIFGASPSYDGTRAVNRSTPLL
jgi:pyridoxamine 5'-phosphate oxidase-like protein